MPPQVKLTTLNETTLRYQLSENDTLLCFREVLEKWQHDPDFQDFYSELLAEVPFAAFYWETPPLTTERLTEPFEFVVCKSKNLPLVSPKPAAFEAYFTDAPVVAFWNLGKDALLVSPTPRKENLKAYAHLANFVREAPGFQQRAFWQETGSRYAAMIDDQARWLSTAGMGVHWLHARLSVRPKYYRHKAYKVP